MSGKGLPPVLRATALERPVNQDVNTDILYPVSINQSQCRFHFNRTGILDSNSQLNLSQIVLNSAKAGVDTNSVLPTSTGALAMIKRAYLEVGGRRVSDLQDVGHYATWKRLHMSNEYKKGIVQPKQSGNDVFVGSAARDIRVSNDVVTQRQRGFTVPLGTLGRESSEYAIDDTNFVGFGVQSTLKTKTQDADARLITADEATTPSFAVGLGQIIPLLSGGVQLPLFAMRETVSLVIEWADNTFGHRFYPPPVASDGTAQNPANCTSTIVTQNIFLMVDYLYFPSMMAELADEIMNRGGFDIPYTEELVVTNTLPIGAADTTFNQNYQLAMGGRKVKHIIAQKELVDGANESIVNIGRYNSLAFRFGESIQLNIDSNNFYSQPLTNGSLIKHEADMVEGTPLQLCDYRYSFFNQVDAAGAQPANVAGLSDRLVNNNPNNAECGSQNWTGIKLENSFGQGLRMSNLPMIYTIKSKAGQGVAADDQDTTRRMRFFVGVQKVINISQGIVTTVE